MVVLILWVAISFHGTSVFSKGFGFCQRIFELSTPDSNNVKIEDYLQSTLTSLEAMRGLNGLLADTIAVKNINGETRVSRVINLNTSPTNIAIDLLVQGELGSLKNVARIVSTLKSLDYHKDSGLFFSRYAADSTSRVADYSVSSVDNFHLALALWTIKESFSGSQIGQEAEKLFDRMDFSVYLDEASGLIGGNLKYQNGAWIKEQYNYSNLGSEARSLYSAGWALGLFKNKQMDEFQVLRSLKSTKAEVFQSGEGPILKLWDGAAFQLFFPKIFIGEDNYSPILKNMFENASRYMVSEGKRRGMPVPASHSPVRRSANETGRIVYQDKVGHRDLISADNKDIFNPAHNKHWDQIFAPYALFMAATSDVSVIFHFSKIEDVKTGGNSLYSKQMGWMDALVLTGDKTSRVVNVQESLNQGMIALSLLEIQSKDHMSLSARALFKNPLIRKRMNFYYKNFDIKLQQP